MPFVLVIEGGKSAGLKGPRGLAPLAGGPLRLAAGGAWVLPVAWVSQGMAAGL